MDDRSERLRKRRKQSTEKPVLGDHPDSDNESKLSKPTKSSEQAEPTKPEAGEDEAEDQPQATSIKEKQIGTYMYLPESQSKDLRRLYNVLKAEYEFEFDEEFEKNRHFYPLVVQYGLESLEGMDASDIRTLLAETFDEAP